MLRLSLALVILGAGSAMVAASAESRGVVSNVSIPAPGQPLNRGHLTSTGETIPRPGLSQSGGETPLDRSIERSDDQTDDSICKGC